MAFSLRETGWRTRMPASEGERRRCPVCRAPLASFRLVPTVPDAPATSNHPSQFTQTPSLQLLSLYHISTLPSRLVVLGFLRPLRSLRFLRLRGALLRSPSALDRAYRPNTRTLPRKPISFTIDVRPSDSCLAIYCAIYVALVNTDKPDIARPRPSSRSVNAVTRWIRGVFNRSSPFTADDSLYAVLKVR